MNLLSTAALLLARTLLGLYFILPGIMKIAGYSGTVAYMEQHHVPLISVLLPLTIVIQICGGVCLILGFHGRWAALLLAGLTIAINIFMHNFWAYPEGVERTHEMQNFIKNLGIFAGLLLMFALGTGKLSLRPKQEQ